MKASFYRTAANVCFFIALVFGFIFVYSLANSCPDHRSTLGFGVEVQQKLTPEQAKLIRNVDRIIAEQNVLNRRAKERLEDFEAFLYPKKEAYQDLRRKLDKQEEITISAAEADRVRLLLWELQDLQIWMMLNGIHRDTLPAVNPDLPPRPKTGPSGSALK